MTCKSYAGCNENASLYSNVTSSALDYFNKTSANFVDGINKFNNAFVESWKNLVDFDSNSIHKFGSDFIKSHMENVPMMAFKQMENNAEFIQKLTNYNTYNKAQ